MKNTLTIRTYRVESSPGCFYYVRAFSPEHALILTAEEVNVSPTEFSLNDVEKLPKEEEWQTVIEYLYDMRGYKKFIINNGGTEPMSVEELNEIIKKSADDIYGVITDNFVDYR